MSNKRRHIYSDLFVEEIGNSVDTFLYYKAQGQAQPQQQWRMRLYPLHNLDFLAFEQSFDKPEKGDIFSVYD